MICFIIKETIVNFYVVVKLIWNNMLLYIYIYMKNNYNNISLGILDFNIILVFIIYNCIFHFKFL